MAFKKLNLKFFLGAALAFIVFGQVFISFAQFGFDTPYEVSSEVGVVKNDFVKARKKAVKIALRSSLEQNLRENLGDDEFERNSQEMQRMLKVSDKYVKSYRFLEAYDDPLELVSSVKLEVNLFQEAISRALSRMGFSAGLEGVEQVIILINESSLSLDEESSFWEEVPISEMLLTRSFIEAGIPVVNRSSLRHEISKKMVISAMGGNFSDLVDIGSKAGVDIVIVGNATSSSNINIEETNAQKVRAGINVKAISSRQSMVVAAKSDFASASENDVFASELEAFRRVGKKMTEFLIPVIQEYWAPSLKNKENQRLVPPVPQVKNSPLPFGDL
ncbi:MAG: hypothetical protein HOB58_04085 [Nitrospina sp.]|nr:hypothetical protein [Nitrospina sp.]